MRISYEEDYENKSVFNRDGGFFPYARRQLKSFEIKMFLLNYKIPKNYYVSTNSIKYLYVLIAFSEYLNVDVNSN